MIHNMPSTQPVSVIEIDSDETYSGQKVTPVQNGIQMMSNYKVN